MAVSLTLLTYAIALVVLAANMPKHMHADQHLAGLPLGKPVLTNQQISSK